jgi:hypothetical protein
MVNWKRQQLNRAFVDVDKDDLAKAIANNIAFASGRM